MSKYLYGAAVQGIQDFIFKTNELKHIVGASELVEQICTTAFNEFAKNGESVVRAAGNIKFIFEKEVDCAKAVREFPKKVRTMAPGITISQAIAVMEDDNDFERAVNSLEVKLLAQRNKPLASTTLGLMAIERSRQTGLPAVEKRGKDFLDEAAVKKRNMTIEGKVVKELAKKESGNIFLSDDVIPYNISDLADKNNWIAIIHIDGNGLGDIIPRIGTNMEKLRIFSVNLDRATTKAAQAAYKDAIASEHYNPMNASVIPIRAIVLNGDDHTLMCNAGIAMDYVRSFLDNFQQETGEGEIGTIIKETLGKDHLTACAGISFVKSSYPFHYGYELAERLCGIAKNASGRNHSCLMFHKVQSGFVEDYKEIERKELTPSNNHSFKFGPYYLCASTQDNGHWTIDELLEQVEALTETKDGNATKNDIRQWLTLMHRDIDAAEQWKKSVVSISTEKQKKWFEKAMWTVKREETYYHPAYDILSLVDVMHKVTKNKEINKEV